MIYVLLGISTDACDAKIFNADYEKSLDKVIQDTISFLLFGIQRENIQFKVHKWILLQFLRNIQNLYYIILIEASQLGCTVIVESILRTGRVHTDSKDSNGRTTLSWAAGNGHGDLAKPLLEKDGISLNSKDSSSRTTLFWAATNGHMLVVKLLLENGTKPGPKGTERGSKSTELESKNTKYSWTTQLSRDIENGYEAIVKWPLERDSWLKSKDNNGRTLFSYAASSGNKVVVKILVAMGAQAEPMDGGC